MPKRIRLLCAGMCALLSLVASLGFAQTSAAQAADAHRSAIEEAGYDAVSVVVAKRELVAGEKLSRADVERTDWRGDYVPEGALSSVEDCVDKRLTSSVAAGAVLCDVDFHEASEGQSVPSGHVAITLSLTKNLGVTSDCTPGANALAYVVGTGGAGVSLVAADAKILGVHAAEAGTSSDTLTLAVLPSDVAAVVAATRNDSLRLVLPADDVVSIPDAVGNEGKTTAVVPSAPVEVLPVAVEDIQKN